MALMSSLIFFLVLPPSLQVMQSSKRKLESANDGSDVDTEPGPSKAQKPAQIKYITRSVAYTDAAEASEGETAGPTDDCSGPFPVHLRWKCSREGHPQGVRDSKKCGCTFVLDVELEFDEAGEPWASVTELRGHLGHVPGDKEDKKWLPLQEEAEAQIGKVSMRALYHAKNALVVFYNYLNSHRCQFFLAYY